MSELTGHVYTQALAGGDPDLFVPPHFLQARVLDPETLAEAAPGAPGLLADLRPRQPRLGLPRARPRTSASPKATASAWLGRAEGAALRGCSLTAEELALARG